MSTSDLSGKVAMVTGGGSGIGQAVCLTLAREGARVSVCDINLEAAQETVALMTNPRQHVALKMNVSNSASVQEGMSATQEKLNGTPTLLVTCAAIAHRCLFLETSEEDFMNILNVNVKGTFLVCQAVCKAMLEKGVANGGSVVNIGSLSGKNGLANHSEYAASKGGVIAFTKTCAKELAGTGIRMNCVIPGPVRTPMLELIPEEFLQEMEKGHPLRRSAKPQEIAETIAFVLSDKSSYTLGSCVEVTGGL